MPLSVETKAPAFSGTTQDGSKVSLAELKGKIIVLYFYPKDDTPGCTKEACGFRDAWKSFEKSGALVIGVSPDSEKSHYKFFVKYKLPFLLLADEEKSIIERYAVWGEKQFMGRKYLGVFRTTYLIDQKGIIRKVWPKVKPDKHADEILEAIKLL
jgi:peroxiredoxin Q/BCP